MSRSRSNSRSHSSRRHSTSSNSSSSTSSSSDSQRSSQGDSMRTQSNSMVTTENSVGWILQKPTMCVLPMWSQPSNHLRRRPSTTTKRSNTSSTVSKERHAAERGADSDGLAVIVGRCNSVVVDTEQVVSRPRHISAHKRATSFTQFVTGCVHGTRQNAEWGVGIRTFLNLQIYGTVVNVGLGLALLWSRP